MIKTAKTVQVSDAKVSADVNQQLVTYSLGSCIAVTVYDPVAKVGAMLHFQLPESRMDPDRAAAKPFMFADTGMDRVLAKVLSMGAEKKRLQVKIAGGAAMDTGPKGFDIGKRNHLAIRKYFWKKGLFIDAEDVGGIAPRNMYLDIEDGKVTVKTNRIEKTL